jgi:hypothetical protein
MTVVRSRWLGFPTPPSSFAPFGVDPGVFRPTAVRSVSRTSWIPLMDFRSPSRTSTAFPSASADTLCDPRTAFHVPPPVGSAAPPTLPARGIHVPARPSSSGSHHLRPLRLVAGFHTRCGPPSPFPTTLTVCPSSSPVTCFSHSRPWGSVSLLPLPPTRRDPVRGPRPSCRRRFGDH